MNNKTGDGSRASRNPTSLTHWEQLRNSVLPCELVRRVDSVAVDRFRMNSLVLMENAGLACVRWLEARFSDPQRVVILCGNGNNGGDGLVIARHLQVLGWQCKCYAVGPVEKMSPDAAANLQILNSDGAAVHWWLADSRDTLERDMASAGVVIDAILGTGAKGDPRSPFDEWIELGNASKAFRVAIDIPTGVDGDSGKLNQPYFEAAATLTFVAKKPAMLRGDAAKEFGEIEVLPIGIPDALIVECLQWLASARSVSGAS